MCSIEDSILEYPARNASYTMQTTICIKCYTHLGRIYPYGLIILIHVTISDLNKGKCEQYNSVYTRTYTMCMRWLVFV